MTIAAPSPYLYVFVDEGGNFDFSPKGSEYFTVTALSAVRSFAWDIPMLSLKCASLEEGINVEYFHASNDRQALRDRVYAVLSDALGSMHLDTLVVEKCKISLGHRPMARFYLKVMGRLLRHVMSQTDLTGFRGVIIVTDTIPVRTRRRAVEKGIKGALAAALPDGTSYRVYHHAAKSCFGLQLADYCNWAVFRKWERSDARSYDLISRAIRSESETPL